MIDARRVAERQMLVATDLTREYPVRGTRQVLTAVAGVSLTLRPRRDPRHRRRIGLRQVDPRPPARPPRGSDVWPHRARRPGRHHARTRCPPCVPPPCAARVPGSLLVTQPADHGRRARSRRSSPSIASAAAAIAAGGSSTCSIASGCRRGSPGVTHTSSPAGNDSASASPAPSPSSRRSSCSTSRCRRSTCPCSRGS